MPDLTAYDSDDDDEVGTGGTRKVKIMRDPGAPTQAEYEKHCITHYPFMPWCPSCVSGQAKDKCHKKSVEQEKGVDEVVFDYGFLGTEDVKETLPVQVMKSLNNGMIFAHVVPRKGLCDDHGVQEIIEDLEKIGLKKIILKSDGEAALKHIQEEVRRRRTDETILENSPVGDSRSNGHAERAVQEIVGRVRTLKHGLEKRTGLVFSSNHSVIPWLVEHASDLHNKFHVNRIGKTPYEIWKGKIWDKETLEFGELVHYKFPKRSSRGKLDDRWAEGIFLGYKWRTGEAMIGLSSGVVKAGSIRRTGENRRWDAARLSLLCGSPWKLMPDGDKDTKGESSKSKVRFMTQEEKEKEMEVREEDEIKPGRVRLTKEDYFDHGFTNGCRGCKAIINKERAQAHSESCRTRMETALDSSSSGKERKRKADERSNEWMAKKLKKGDDNVEAERQAGSREETEGEAAKRRKFLGKEEESSSSSSSRKEVFADEIPNTLKRNTDEEVTPPENKRSRKEEDEDQDLLEASNLIDNAAVDLDLIEILNCYCDQWEPISYDYDPHAWEVSVFSDMCQPEEFGDIDYDRIYYDENSWEPLDPKLVRLAEDEEMNRFQRQDVYEYVRREVALQEKDAKFIKVRWVRVNKGSKRVPKVRCRLVAQELGHGVKDDELYAGTPSLSTLKLLLSWYCVLGGEMNVVKVIDIKCAFLYGEARRKLFIELPDRDPQFGLGFVGRLKKAMYGTRDAPLIWRSTVDTFMKESGFTTVLTQPGVYVHVDRGINVMTHVDDFLVTGSLVETTWFENLLKSRFEITSTTLGRNFEKSAKYLNRTIVWTEEGLSIEGDEKHAQVLLSEWGMSDCKGVSTPVVREEELNPDSGDLVLCSKGATRYRRAAARINYMSQDRPDLAVASRRLSQGMKEPRQSDEVRLKRVLRYVKDHPRCVSFMNWQSKQNGFTLLVDSDWAGEKKSRKSCSGGCILLGSHLIAHWSKLQGTVALSSGEAELNAAVKGVSEIIGIQELAQEFNYQLSVTLCTDATVCKSILLRHGSGRIKHLSTKQLWVQGAIESYGIKVTKVPRAINSSDLMTHCCGTEDFRDHLVRLNQKHNLKVTTRQLPEESP